MKYNREDLREHCEKTLKKYIPESVRQEHQLILEIMNENTTQQQEIERLKSRIVELEGKGKRCTSCKNRHRAHNISCVLICCENVDPVRNNTEVSHYVPVGTEV